MWWGSLGRADNTLMEDKGLKADRGIYFLLFFFFCQECANNSLIFLIYENAPVNDYKLHTPYSFRIYVSKRFAGRTQNVSKSDLYDSFTFMQTAMYLIATLHPTLAG